MNQYGLIGATRVTSDLSTLQKQYKVCPVCKSEFKCYQGHAWRDKLSMLKKREERKSYCSYNCMRSAERKVIDDIRAEVSRIELDILKTIDALKKSHELQNKFNAEVIKSELDRVDAEARAIESDAQTDYDYVKTVRCRILYYRRMRTTEANEEKKLIEKLRTLRINRGKLLRRIGVDFEGMRV